MSMGSPRGRGCLGPPWEEGEGSSGCSGHPHVGHPSASHPSHPAFPLLPSSANLGPSSSAVTAGVPRVGTWDLWVEMRLHKCHHSKLIPNGGVFFNYFSSPSHFFHLPIPAPLAFPICGCIMGMDKHLLLRCHKCSFPKILVTTLCLASVTQKNAKRGHGDVSCITPILPFRNPKS